MCKQAPVVLFYKVGSLEKYFEDNPSLRLVALAGLGYAEQPAAFAVSALSQTAKEHHKL